MIGTANPMSSCFHGFFGFCVIAIGVVSLMPALYFGIVFADAESEMPIARWACVAAFVGGVHLLYGVYITQLVDYSAMQMLAVFIMLVVTCLYGFTGMSLMLDDGDGRIANLLQIPFALKRQAMIWCGIMFGVNALACYLFGREAMAWQRRTLTRSRMEANEA